MTLLPDIGSIGLIRRLRCFGRFHVVIGHLPRLLFGVGVGNLRPVLSRFVCHLGLPSFCSLQGAGPESMRARPAILRVS